MADAMPTSDLDLIAALRTGDESAFAALVDRYLASMKRIALLFVSDPAVADEVIQETWIGVLRGLDRFEGRSSLKTWIFTILTNRAKTYGQREGRYVPIDLTADESEPTVSPSRFRPTDPWLDHWTTFPASWDDIPEARLLSDETQRVIANAIAQLPRSQHDVIVLRDIEGWDSYSVCNALDISETNQRVLLHRARAKVRAALEKYFAQE